LLMGMSVVFMTGFKYSELWLISRLEPYQFCALEHTKYFMASIGQWFLQNMAHATIFAAVGKALFVVSALRYWVRADEMETTATSGGIRAAKEKFGPKSSLAG
uniref:TMC domain-containing protein n=1 Tax=Globodera pallida TaxID=36090 RepID=A0A183CN05_GLOPA